MYSYRTYCWIMVRCSAVLMCPLKRWSGIQPCWKWTGVWPTAPLSQWLFVIQKYNSACIYTACIHIDRMVVVAATSLYKGLIKALVRCIPSNQISWLISVQVVDVMYAVGTVICVTYCGEVDARISFNSLFRWLFMHQASLSVLQKPDWREWVKRERWV